MKPPNVSNKVILFEDETIEISDRGTGGAFFELKRGKLTPAMVELGESLYHERLARITTEQRRRKVVLE